MASLEELPDEDRLRWKQEFSDLSRGKRAEPCDPTRGARSPCDERPRLTACCLDRWLEIWIPDFPGRLPATLVGRILAFPFSRSKGTGTIFSARCLHSSERLGKPRIHMSADRAPTLAQTLAEANACCRGGELARAEQLSRTVLATDPDNVDAQFVLGDVFLAQGRLSESAACWQRIVELRPENAAAHNNLGAALERLGNLPEAAGCYRAAIAIQPGLAVLHYNLVQRSSSWAGSTTPRSLCVGPWPSILVPPGRTISWRSCWRDNSSWKAQPFVLNRRWRLHPMTPRRSIIMARS